MVWTSADITANVRKIANLLCTQPKSIKKKITSDLISPDPLVSVFLTMIYFLDCWHNGLKAKTNSSINPWWESNWHLSVMAILHFTKEHHFLKFTYILKHLFDSKNPYNFHMLRTISQETNTLHAPSQFISSRELINSFSGTVCSNAEIEIVICKTIRQIHKSTPLGGEISLL